MWGWTDARTLLCVAAGVVITAYFVSRQGSHPEPILDLALLSNRSFSAANFSALAFFAGFVALGLNSVLFLRQAWGYDVLTGGLLSAIAPLVWFLVSVSSLIMVLVLCKLGRWRKVQRRPTFALSALVPTGLLLRCIFGRQTPT